MDHSWMLHSAILNARPLGIIRILPRGAGDTLVIVIMIMIEIMIRAMIRIDVVLAEGTLLGTLNTN